MATWVDDIIQALKNLGGQATLKNIYAEFERIRPEPLPKTWQANIRGRIENFSSDSEAFTGKDYFRKVGKGTWALRDIEVINLPPKPKQEPSQPIPPKEYSGYEIPESFDAVIYLLQTIKQYRDYADPASATWINYIENFFQILGFHTEKQDSRLILIGELGGSDTSKAIVGYSLPGENFDEIIPDIKWETYLLFAVKNYDLEWGILTNGLQLKVIKYNHGRQQDSSFWPNLDDIIKNERTDSFIPVYKMLSAIMQVPKDARNYVTPELM